MRVVSVLSLVAATGILLFLFVACTGPGGGGVERAPDGESNSSVPSPDAGGGAQSEAGPIVTVPLAACQPNVYTAAVTFGGTQSFDLLLDTGSTTLAVAGAPCPSCTDAGVASLYQPGPSASDQHVPADELFGALSPSGWRGEVYEDDVSLAAGAATVRMKFVDIQEQSAFMVGTCGPSKATPAGVIGFAPSEGIAGTSGIFDRLVAGGGMEDVFATRLCESTGTLWLGGYDSKFVTAPPVFTPRWPPNYDGFYTVQLASITVSASTIPMPTGDYPAAMLDTGASISSLPEAAYAALVAAIEASPAFSAIVGPGASTFFSSANNCARLTQSREELDAKLPPLVLAFGPNGEGPMVHASATEAYLQERASGIWCPSITARDPGPGLKYVGAILGAPVLQSNVVIFDRANRRIGFAPHTPCR